MNKKCKPKLFGAEFCPNCRAVKRWFPDGFDYVDVTNWTASEIESAGVTALPMIEAPDGKKFYAGAMSKKMLEEFLKRCA